jgi:hypothetical protein
MQRKSNKYYTLWVCVCSQHDEAHAKAYVACLDVTYFSTLFHKQRDYRKKIWNIKCVFTYPLQLLTHLILRRTEQYVILYIYIYIYIYMYVCVCVCVCVYSSIWPIILGRFEWHLKFGNRFSKNIKTSKFVQLEMTCSARLDGQMNRRTNRQTYMTKLIVAWKLPRCSLSARANRHFPISNVYTSNEFSASYVLSRHVECNGCQFSFLE